MPTASANCLPGNPAACLLEVGPGQTLAPMVRQHPSAAKDSGVTVLATLQDGRDEGESALTALGRLWLEGVEIDWTAFHAAARRARAASHLPVRAKAVLDRTARIRAGTPFCTERNTPCLA